MLTAGTRLLEQRANRRAASLRATPRQMLLLVVGRLTSKPVHAVAVWVVDDTARVERVVLVEQRLVHQVLEAAVFDENDVVVNLCVYDFRVRQYLVVRAAEGV